MTVSDKFDLEDNFLTNKDIPYESLDLDKVIENKKDSFEDKLPSLLYTLAT